MKRYDGWRSSSWVRLAEPIPIQAMECAEYKRKPHWSIYMIGPVLILLALVIVVIGIAR